MKKSLFEHVSGAFNTDAIVNEAKELTALPNEFTTLKECFLNKGGKKNSGFSSWDRDTYIWSDTEDRFNRVDFLPKGVTYYKNSDNDYATRSNGKPKSFSIDDLNDMISKGLIKTK